MEDTSDFGLGTCAKYILEAQEQAGSRFSRDLQVDDEGTEKTISWFAGIGFDEDLDIIASDFKNFSEKIRAEKKKLEIDKFRKKHFEKLIIKKKFIDEFDKLKNLRDNHDTNSSTHLFTAKEREQISGIISKAKHYLDNLDLLSKKD